MTKGDRVRVLKDFRLVGLLRGHEGQVERVVLAGPERRASVAVRFQGRQALYLMAPEQLEVLEAGRAE